MRRGPRPIAVRAPARTSRGLAAAAALVLALSCRHATASPGDGSVTPDEIAPEHAQAYQRVLDAQKSDPTSEETALAAQALIDAGVAGDVRVAAQRALAEQAWAVGDDARAIAAADAGLAEIAVEAQDGESGRALRRVLAFALARSGDPSRALTVLSALDASAAIPTLELRAARAVATDRHGPPVEAMRRYAEWRELLPQDSAEAAWCEQRLSAIGPSVSPADAAAAAQAVSGPDAGACLRVRAGAARASGRAAWVDRCAPPPARVGLLLPRSGAFSALADPHLAAALAAARVLSGTRGLTLEFEDSGSTTPDVERALARLERRDVDRIVGPIGASNVKALAHARGRLVIPGESVAGAVGVAPTLEQRVTALVAHAAGKGRKSVVLLTPTGTYGDRSRAAATSECARLGLILRVATYAPQTTSFAPVLAGAGIAWGKPEGRASAVIVADSLSSLEMVARQFAREGIALADASDASRGPLVLGTAEGYSADGLGRGHEVLEGTVVAPVAALDADSTEFEREYVRIEGKGPSDQSLLVWRAVAAAEALARSGAPAQAPQAGGLARVEGGRVVALRP